MIMDTAVEEDTEEERKMPLAIMQGYMTIIQVSRQKNGLCCEYAEVRMADLDHILILWDIARAF